MEDRREEQDWDFMSQVFGGMAEKVESRAMEIVAERRLDGATDAQKDIIAKAASKQERKRLKRLMEKAAKG